MPLKGAGKWQALLADKDVKRWYDNLARGSRATADNYVRVLGRFLDANALTPDSFIKLHAKQRDDTLADHVAAMLDAGRAGSYVEVTKKAVRLGARLERSEADAKDQNPGVLDAPLPPGRPHPEPGRATAGLPRGGPTGEDGGRADRILRRPAGGHGRLTTSAHPRLGRSQLSRLGHLPPRVL